MHGFGSGLFFPPLIGEMWPSISTTAATTTTTVTINNTVSARNEDNGNKWAMQTTC